MAKTSHQNHVKTVRSVVAAEALIPLLSEAYALPEPIQCHLYAVGDNDTYLVEAGTERFALRVYYPNRFWLSGVDEYRFEIDWLSFCHSRGLPVSYAIPCTDGEFLNELQAPEGLRPWALFTYAPGVVVFPMTIAQYHTYGKYIAKFHTESRDFDCIHKRFHYGAEVLIDRPIESLSDFFGEEDKGVLFLRDLAPRLRDHLNGLYATGDGYGVIGGDFHGGNHHLDSEGKMTFFDFDSCGYGFRAYDLAVLRHNSRLGDWNAEIANAVLAGYESIRPLSDEERQSIPLFMITRRIWRLATRVQESLFKGISTLRDRVWEDGIRALRVWSVEAGIRGNH